MILNEICRKLAASDEFRSIYDARMTQVSIEGISPSSFPVIAASVFLDRPRQILIVTETIQIMTELYMDLSCFLDEVYLYKFPSWETLPYEFMSPSESTERDRITALYKL